MTSAYKLLKNNIIKSVGKGIELKKKIIPSEVIHTQKGTHNMYSLRRPNILNAIFWES